MFCTYISVLYPVCSLCNSTQTTPYLSHISAYFNDQNLDILFCLRTQFWIALPFGEKPQLPGHSHFQNNETQDMLVYQFIMLHNLHTEIWTSKVKLHISSFDLFRKKHWFWSNRRGYTTHRQTTAFCSWALSDAWLAHEEFFGGVTLCPKNTRVLNLKLRYNHVILVQYIVLLLRLSTNTAGIGQLIN